MMNFQSTKSKKLIKITKIIIISIFVIIAGLTMLSLLGIPKQLRIFVVETGSMEPTIRTGSLIFDIPQDNYNVGDVITFNQPAETTGSKATPITHRIHSIKTDPTEVIETKGDANQTPDALTITKDLIIGKTIFSIPFVGLVINFAKSQIGFLVLIIIPTIIIIYNELMSIRKEFNALTKKKKDDLTVKPEENV